LHRQPGKTRRRRSCAAAAAAGSPPNTACCRRAPPELHAPAEAGRRETERAHPGNPALVRSLRCAQITALEVFGERQIIIDCDVIQADGGTRTASITGGFVALYQCISFMTATS
jgi:hypothetical protein